MRGRLNIFGGAWHMRIYRHWRGRIAHSPPAQVDLCHYMRAIILFVPGFWFSWALVHFAKLLTYPIWGPVRYLRRRNKARDERPKRIEGFLRRYSGLFGYAFFGLLGLWVLVLLVLVLVDLWMAAWWLVIVAPLMVIVALALLFLVAIGIGHFSRWLNERSKKDKSSKPRRERKPRPDPAPSLTWTWIKAKKMKICPLIETDADLAAPESESGKVSSA